MFSHMDITKHERMSGYVRCGGEMKTYVWFVRSMSEKGSSKKRNLLIHSKESTTDAHPCNHAIPTSKLLRDWPI